MFRIETTWEYVNQFVFTTFCLCFSFTGINSRVTLHHVCDVAYDENWCGPIRTRKYRSANWLINYMWRLYENAVVAWNTRGVFVGTSLEITSPLMPVENYEFYFTQ